MKSENVVHIKVEYLEALKSKKEILSSEINLLRIVKAIKKYRPLRAEELKLKLKLYKSLKEINTNLKKLEKTLPQITTNKISKKEPHSESAEIDKTIKKVRKQYDDSLESQLRDIQGRLLELQR